MRVKFNGKELDTDFKTSLEFFENISKNENVDVLTDPEAIVVTVSESHNDIPEEDTEEADSAES